MKKTIIPITLFLFCVHTNAQQAVTNSGNLQIHTGASVSGFDNFTNVSTGVLVNNGNLYIKGIITNDQSSMTTGAGTLYLDGSIAQAVNGSQAFKTYHLNTNNSSGITLNNNLSVSGTHTFTSGLITTSATPNYLIYEAGSSYTGDGNSRHVNGWVKKTGSTNFIFPLGNGTVERTIALNSLSVSSEFNAKYFANTPNSYYMQSPPVWDVNESEYWSIGKVSGGTATVAMNWDNSKVYFPNWIVADILVAGYNGSLWTNNGGASTASGTAATTGTVASNSISAFSLFALASRSYILPLTLLSFTAYRQNNYTRVDWITEREYDTDHFVVERSDDGVRFYDIAKAGARNSGNTEVYSYDDHAPLVNIAYYRLRSVGIDRKEILSRVVSVKGKNPDDLLTLVVNPVYDQVILDASSRLNGVFHYRIHGINGQLVQEGKLIIQNGGGQYKLPLKGSPEPGAYTLQVTKGPQSFRFKLIIH
jgi:hypothetical protein